jgi:hypothetical protein
MAPKVIPLSILAEDAMDPSQESVDTLMASIRQLVSGQEIADDIIDLNRPVQPQEWHLSEKTVSESTHALNSFISALTEPTVVADQAQDVHPAPISSPGQGSSQGLNLEAFVSECLREPLNQWVQDHGGALIDMVRMQVNQQINPLLQQWLDTHLPQLIKESIDQHLQSLIQSVKKKP